MLRSIVAHSEGQESKITSFTCTHCLWSYRIEQAQSDRIKEQDVRRACLEFDAHDCSQHGKRKQQLRP